MKHDKNFLSNADISKFNMNILDLHLSQECQYLYKIIEKSPKNSIVLDIGAYNGNTSLYISKLLKKHGFYCVLAQKIKRQVFSLTEARLIGF